MAKKLKRRKFSLFSPVLSVFYVACSLFFLAMIYHDVNTTVDLKNQIEENEALKDSVLAEEKNLQDQKEKLTNPDYIEYLARGKYLITKWGEQVFKFPSVDEIE